MRGAAGDPERDGVPPVTIGAGGGGDSCVGIGISRKFVELQIPIFRIFIVCEVQGCSVLVFVVVCYSIADLLLSCKDYM